jgi:hypothetical protein
MTQQLPPLLAIAVGRKPRARKQTIPAAKEIDLHCDVADLLRRFGRDDWRTTHFPAGEKRDVITGARLKRLGLARGWADFLCISPRGALDCLELKRRGECLTDDQRDFQAFCMAAGVAYVVASDIAEATAILSEWGVLKIKIAPPIGGGQ